ncbi:MAG: BREX-1 system adenine-specific DNA-methyltransferase PglX [Clostridium sp.]|nr:BREX-1 system adenine-specific DNA-methyltransferase PglX [Clostridium sp.]
MNKNAIKKFAIDARNKLIASVTDKAGMLGITKDACSEPITKGVDFEVYKTTAGTEVTLNKKQCEHRRKLVEQIKARGFDAVIEEVAYTWFNRICAIRFMEVNDYMYPARVRVLSSEKAGKNEPDILTLAPDIDWEFTEEEREYIIDAKMNNKLDDLFRMLFIKQCNLLHEVLPGLFEETEDYTEMLLNISFTNEDDVIRMLIDSLDEADFNVSTLDENGNPTGQVEIIGWLYQYYNTELKDDTFAKLKKNIKITKERIPAATQLFTPDWIVRYMVENSVGRIWIEHLRANDPSVDEKATAERFGWKYYQPEAEQEDEVNVKLAEIRTTYKDLKPTDITCMDPCMGSGHILIAMFDVLMDIYESAGYDKREAAFDIVEHNIHGLDIDKRAYQLAYFAVMMKGRGYNRRFFRGRDDVKPAPNVYAIVESNDIEKNHLQFFGASMPESERTKAEEQIKYLLHTFVDAREYGSILNVDVCDWELLDRFVNDLNDNGQVTFESLGSEETQENLKRLIKIAEIMSKKYYATVTNPPYMGSRKGMNSKLKKYVDIHYKDSKADLYTCFIEQGLFFTKKIGYTSLITQQSFMFTDDYKELRKKIIDEHSFVNMVHMGADAFPEISGEVVQTAAYVLRNQFDNLQYKSKYIRLVDYSCEEKESQLYNKLNYYYACGKTFSDIKAIPFSYWLSSKMRQSFTKGISFENYGVPRQGIATGDNDSFLRMWLEVNWLKIGIGYDSVDSFHNSEKKYIPYNKGGRQNRWYGNNDYVLMFDKNNYDILMKQGNHLPSRQYYCKKCITWSDISGRSFAARYCNNGAIFDVKGSCAFPKKENYWLALALLNSKLTPKYVESLNPTTTTQVGDLKRIPVIEPDNDIKQKLNNVAQKCVEITKNLYDCYEVSWDFKRHPLLSVIPRNPALFDNTDDIDLSECYTYWENECNERFKQLKANEEELNRIFIEIYGLQDELTPEVEDKDVTVRKADLQRDIKSLISYAVGCMFGRYSLDEEGLILAGQSFESHFFEASAPRCGTGFAGAPGMSLPTGEFYYKIQDEVKKCSFNPDKDNIIPITDEEYFEDDIVSRFCTWLKTAFGAKSLETNLDFIANALGNKGDTSREVIRNYFLNDFFKDHCNTYSVTGSGKRPIYWLFDSGKQNGFKALIYMHRYDADTVGRVRTDYLHKAQKYVETAMQGAQYTLDNASSSLEKSKATKSITKYTKQLAEMQIYDEAIAHIANQRIEIDLDDGVKVNYAKFQGVEVAQEGKKALKVDLLAKI